MNIFLLYWREILSITAVTIGLYWYSIYIHSILRGKTEPHIFSWWIWTLINGIAFFAQVAGGWWWGTAQNGLSFFACLIISLIWFKYGKLGKLDRLDWYVLMLSFTAIIWWQSTNNPFYGSLFIMFADMISLIPTLRKVWKYPESEPTKYYLISNLKNWLWLASLSVYTPTTMMFPLSVIIVNSILVFIQIFRIKK